MTKIFMMKTKCFVCGSVSEHAFLGSTNILGAPDLDTRPSEMLRSEISAEVQQCPDCGYCAEKISAGSKKAPAIVKSQAYRKQLKNNEYAPLANRFLCKAMIEKADGNLANAAWSYVYAAWACDDNGNNKKASKARITAARLLIEAESKNVRIAKAKGVSIQILVDLLRRAGKFKEAITIIENRLPRIKDKKTRQILLYQKELLNKHDSGCYTIEDALRKKQLKKGAIC